MVQTFRLFSYGIALLIALAFLSSCNREEAKDFTQQVVALGTVVDFTLYDVDDATGHEATARMGKKLNELHTRWHPWQPSEITRLNTELAAGRAVETDAETALALELGLKFHAQTGGLFNPGLGALVELWGFNSDDPPKGPPPSKEAINVAIERATAFPTLTIQGTHISTPRRDLQIDLGALAQGYAVDRCAEILREMGIHNAIINAGGDLMILGQHGKRPWRIGIRHPRQPGVLAAIAVKTDEAIVTSGDYERFFEYEGVRYHHIMDPRTGLPARGAIAVTVIHPSSIVADAASTALMVAGIQSWREAAKALGVKDVMLIDEEMNVHLTASMRERVEFSPELKLSLIVQGGE